MNIFEDLVEELKDENLLEETVIEVHRENPVVASPPVARANAENPEKPAGNIEFQPIMPLLLTNDAAELKQEMPADTVAFSAAEVDLVEEPAAVENSDALNTGFEFAEAKKFPAVEKSRGFVNEKEYFRKRAMDEVTGLQMVDHVLSGVEREQMKLVPKPYDDLPVKLALHDFLQVAHETNSTEHAQAEFRLMQETENWCSALSHREKHVSIAHLRRHCETTRPPLSAQALIALARFFRNSSYTEAVRSKFELVVTRLFTREIENDRRELALSSDEIVQQLKELYADWSSIQLYSSSEEDSDILISVLKFEDFVNEAENTKTFDELIASGFFNRLRMFKQDCNENFFAPLVTVAAIEANVKIGNLYVELLEKEKEKFNAAALEEKYGFLHDQAVSDATGKTFELAELLQQRDKNVKNELSKIVEVSVKEKNERSRVERTVKKPRNKLFAVNKWLLAATILTIIACAGLYGWAEYQGQEVKTSPSVKKVNLENSEFKDFIQNARISEETFYGVTTAAWESVNGEKKEQLLKKLLSIGAEKNFKKVHLVNTGGRAVGFASAEKTEVYNQ